MEPQGNKGKYTGLRRTSASAQIIIERRAEAKWNREAEERLRRSLLPAASAPDAMTDEERLQRMRRKLPVYLRKDCTKATQLRIPFHYGLPGFE